jgi:hypothetical protein
MEVWETSLMNSDNLEDLLHIKENTESNLQESITEYHNLCTTQNSMDKDYCRLKNAAKKTALLAHSGMEIGLHLGDDVFLATMGKRFNYFAHQVIIHQKMCTQT